MTTVKKKLAALTLTAAMLTASAAAPLSDAGYSNLIPSVVSTITASAASNTPAQVTVKSKYSCTTNAIRINWNKVSGATGYRIYRYNSTTKKWVKIKTIKNGSTTTYRDSGLTAGTTYKYKVKAYKKVNGTNYWGTSSATKTAVTKPKAVTMKSSSCTSDAIRLNWNTVKCDGYKIYQKKNGKYVCIKTIYDSSVSTYRVSGLSEYTKYYFKVRPFKKDGSGTPKYGTSGQKTKTTKIKTSLTAAEKKQYINDIFKYINQCRSSYGLYSYELDENLNEVAAIRAEECASLNVMTHTRPDGSDFSSLIFEKDWYDASYVYEEIIATDGLYVLDCKIPVDAWLASAAGHREAVLSAYHTQIGIGVAQNGGELFVVAILGGQVIF